MNSIRIPALTFDALAQRVVRDLASLIHSGAITERRLAGVVGLSQPHLHNVLSGARKLTPAIADQVIEALDWSLLNLIETSEALALIGRRQASVEHVRDLPVQPNSGVGPGCRLRGPTVEAQETLEADTEVAVPNRWLVRAGEPIVATAGEDPEMEGIVESGAVLLIDCSPSVGLVLHHDALYVVRWGGQSLARWVRFSARGLYLISALNWSEPRRWTHAVTESSRRQELIEGKIIALAQPPDRTFQRPAQPFVSN